MGREVQFDASRPVGILQAVVGDGAAGAARPVVHHTERGVAEAGRGEVD